MRYVDAYCDIAGANDFNIDPDKPCLYAHDGSTCTLLRLHGTRTHLSDAEAMDRMVDAFQTIASNLREKGHGLTITFEQSGNTREDIDGLMNPMREASVRKGLDTASQLDELEGILQKTLVAERILIAVWTYKDIAVKAQLREEMNERRDSFGRIPFKGAVQNPAGPIRALQAEHWGMVNAVQSALSLEGFVVEILGGDKNKRDDLTEVRRALLYHETPPDWSPMMPGDVRYPKAKPKKTADISDLFAPTLDQQIMTSAARGTKDLRTVEIGGRQYAIAHLGVFPRHMTSFRSLLRAIRGSGVREKTMPFRIAFHIEGGISINPFKKFFVTLGQIFSQANKYLYQSLSGIESWVTSGEETGIHIRIYATTWVEPDEPAELLADRRAQLVRALNGWQSPTVYDSSPDPLRTLAETAAGMTAVAKTGLPVIGPVREIALALPFHSDAPPEHLGETVFVTLDGKPYAFKAHSQLQANWLSLIWAPPGSGKSLLMNSMNIDFAANYPAAQLPFIGAIDIGVSSRGFIRTLQVSLPPDQRNLVSFVRMQNDINARDYFINPFDIGLGRRFPLKREQSFIQNFLLALIGLSEDPQVNSLCEYVITTLYARNSDMTVSSTPKMWQEDVDHDLEGKIRQLGIDLHDDLSWWKLVDDLANRDEFALANRAQRNAVPVLQDVVRVLSEEETKKRFGEELVRKVQTQVVSAINTFPCFSHATQMDIGEARVVSIDLDPVVHRVPNTDADRRSNVLFFLMARELFMKKVAGEVAEVPIMRAPDDILPVYQKYWTDRYADIAQTRKRFNFDEFHICGSSPIMESQIDQDVRQGRKWGLEIVLASQRIGDFRGYVDLASNIFVLKSDSGQDRAEMKAVLNLSDAVVDAVKKEVRGPNPITGSTFLIGRKMNAGESWLLVRNKVGPVRIWSLTTTPEDMALRDKMYEMLGDVNRALEILAARFPSGSAREHWAKVSSEAKQNEDIAMTISQNLLNEHMAEKKLIG